LAVLLVPTIGVLPSSIITSFGYSTSSMATRTTAIRTSPIGFVLFGLFNHLSI